MTSNKHAVRLALALAVAAAVPAMAETVSDELNVMGAQVQLLNKRQELQAALARSAGMDVASLPKVVAVYGMDRKLQARLLLPSGVVSTYEEGDVVRGAMKVSAITAKTVIVSVGSGKKAVTLPLDFVAGGQTGTAGTPGMPSPLGGGPGGTGTGPLPPELLPPPPPIGSPIAPPARAAAPAAPTAPAGAAPGPGAAPGAPGPTAAAGIAQATAVR